jgi:drug/metabolite transporter (DMT)-like permease
MAMLMWAVGFPSGEILLETWGAISLLSVRMLLAVGLLMVFWIVAEGMPTVLAAPWGHGLIVGGIGFGFGAILLLVGQKMSDPVTPPTWQVRFLQAVEGAIFVYRAPPQWRHRR